jgi:hypothetical protein
MAAEAAPIFSGGWRSLLRLEKGGEVRCILGGEPELEVREPVVADADEEGTQARACRLSGLDAVPAQANGDRLARPLTLACHQRHGHVLER